jgi:DNA-binding NarL/FixJ family response regulator
MAARPIDLGSSFGSRTTAGASSRHRRAEPLMPPLVALRLLRQLRDESDESRAKPLTLWHAELLALMARGLQNKEIAATVVRGEGMAKFHVEAVLRKLGVANRTEAVAIAGRRPLLQP